MVGNISYYPYNAEPSSLSKEVVPSHSSGSVFVTHTIDEKAKTGE